MHGNDGGVSWIPTPRRGGRVSNPPLQEPWGVQRGSDDVCVAWGRGVTLTPALSRRGRGGRSAAPAIWTDGGQGVAVGLECDLSAYDAEFVVLARTLGVRLVTLNGGILEGGDVAAGLTGRGNSVGHGEYSAF